MRRLVVLGLVGALAFTFVGSPASRAATTSATWPVGQAPFGLGVDESTGKVYVANSGSVVYDINNPSSGPHGLISVVDPATGTVGRILTSQNSNFVVVDSASRRLYSSNATTSGSSHSVQVFDLDSAAMLATIPVGGLGMGLDRQAGRLYVCESGSVKVIDTTTFAVLASATAPASASWFNAAVDPERHHLYLTNIRETSPTFFVLDDRDLTTIAEIPVTTATRFALTVDPVSHDVVMAGGQWVVQPNGTVALTAALSVVDPDTLTVVHSTPLPGIALGMALAPSRHRIYVSDSNWRLNAVDDTTFALLESVRMPFSPGEMLMHPDGRLYVGVYDGTSHLDSTLVAVDLANHSPIFGTPTFLPAVPTTGDTVRADAPAYDPDYAASLAGDPLTYTYQWARNGTPIAGATRSTLDLSVAGNGDRGDTITVAVTVTDPQGALSSESASFIVANAAPVVAAHLNTTSPRTNDRLIVSSDVSDPDGDPLTVSYEWLRNGSVVPGATSNTFDLAALGDHGDTITARVTAADDHGGVSRVSLDAVVMNAVPTVGLVLSDQSPRTNDVLTATASGFDLDADVLTYDFEFWLNGTYVSSGVFASNVSSWNLANPPFGNRGDTITMYVSAWDGTTWSQRTSASAVIVNSPPDVTVSLDNKTPTSKAVLVATAAGSDADGDPMTFTYTWQVGKKVKQTTTTTATTNTFDLAGKVSNGDLVTVTVTATDGYVSSAGASDTAIVTNNPRH
jgi:DNA-binding beta-propeller fold protein YncE